MCFLSLDLRGVVARLSLPDVKTGWRRYLTASGRMLLGSGKFGVFQPPLYTPQRQARKESGHCIRFCEFDVTAEPLVLRLRRKRPRRDLNIQKTEARTVMAERVRTGGPHSRT